MANTTITALPAATTPLTGTEVVPIVQSGVTKKVAVSAIGGGGSGTVTSVGISAPAFLSVGGSPITSSGTLALTYSGTALPVVNGGTGQTTANAALNALLPSQSGQSGNVLTTNGTNTSWTTVSGTGTVTSVSVATANGFAGTVANATTTPAITLTTSVTGVLKGNGSAISAATAGTDYQAPISLTTTGTSGAATFVGNVLNIPQYTGGGGSGTVTSVAQTFTGGIVSVGGSPITSSGTLALTVAGTSGGVPYFSGANTWASSAVLASNALVVGGGSGSAPATVTTGTGVVTALGVNTGASGAFVVNGGDLGTPSGGVVTNLTGTASININGTVGASTPTTGIFTTATARSSAVQDFVALQGRAGGTNSYGVTLTPTTLTGSRTLTLPDASGTILQSGTAVTVAQGGTGATTAISAFNALAPSQSGNSGKYLTTDGTNTSWATVSGGGSPGGSNTQIQFNNSSAFGGSANLTWDGANVQIGSAGALRLADSDSSNYASFQSPATLAANTAYTLPSALPTANGSTLVATTAGVMSWADAAAPTSLTVDFLVIAGGGGGANGGGGGGGAGGYRTSTGTSGGGGAAESALTLAIGTAYTVTVGGPGTGAISTYAAGGFGFNSVLSSITSLGGGGGGSNAIDPTGGGGSGGGCGLSNSPYTGGAGTATQGYRGGNGSTAGVDAGTGGGGAGATGTDKVGTGVNATTGGIGVQSSITGSSVYRAGGGGGGAQGSYGGGAAAAGGTGGGGAGTADGATGTAGTTNTGGGGGGGGYAGTSGNGGNGGSGVVYIQIASARTATFSAGVTSSVATVGAYKVYTVTATSTTSETVTFS
jgi:hypothetical protein